MKIKTKIIRVLLIENDVSVIHDLTEYIEKERAFCSPPTIIKLTVVRNVEDARKELVNKVKGFDVILTDIMLPINNDSQIELEQLEARRRQQQIKLIHYIADKKNRIDLSGEILRLRKELSEIDDCIDTNLDIEGGYNVLNGYLNSKGPKCYDRPVIVISSRMDLDLKERFKKLVSAEKYLWLEKPVSANDIFYGIISFFDIKVKKESCG